LRKIDACKYFILIPANRKITCTEIKKITSMGLKIAGVRMVVKIPLLEMLEKVSRYAESSLQPELIFVLSEF
jgi:hypothetical protein